MATTNTELITEIRGMRADIQANTLAMGETRAKFDAQQKTIGHVTADLYGNGKPGLKADMQEVRSDVLMIKRVSWSCILILLAAAARQLASML